MTNIINELEQRNKELLEEINNLNKKREADIEELKLKIWHVTGQSLDDKGEVSMHAPRGTWWYKKLNKKWIDEGKLRMEMKLGNELRVAKEFDLIISLLKKCWKVSLIVLMN